MNQLLSTDAVPRDQRLAYWTDMICNVYVQLGCDPVRPDDIAGRLNAQPALADWHERRFKAFELLQHVGRAVRETAH